MMFCDLVERANRVFPGKHSGNTQPRPRRFYASLDPQSSDAPGQQQLFSGGQSWLPEGKGPALAANQRGCP